MRLSLVLFLLIGFLGQPVLGQVTTATITGRISEQGGGGLPGATVLAVHQPSGTQYGVTTRDEGQFTLPNLRVGGPYRITVTFVGYQTETIDDVFLSLGQKLPLNVALQPTSATLNEVVVRSDANDVLNNSRTGPQTNVSSEQLRLLPTITRSVFDYTRLTPQAGNNGTFGGRLNRFNNFSLNGAIFNNPFGLDAATPGGQTDAQPVSLDAIEQVQVTLSPFDVTQAGFTAASINAVTKSGTNRFTGTAFGFFRNQNLTGTRVKGTDIIVPESSQLQAGFSLGGPIIKNKLFFFVNAEIDRRADLGTDGWVARRPGLEGANVARVLAADMERVSTTLRTLASLPIYGGDSRFNYETGPYENFTYRTRNSKGIVKLDWNINRVHKLSVIYNFLDAFRDKPAHPSAIGRRGPDFLTLQFQNSGYRINNRLHGGIVELNSNFNGRFANKLQVGYTAFRDSRDPFSTPFPVININRDGVRYIVAGHEPFSINNRLTQDVFQITNNVNVYAGKHTLTIGGTFERFNFDNSFNLDAYGGTFSPGFASVQAFVDSVARPGFRRLIQSAQERSRQGNWALAETNVGQLGLYAQDEFAVTPRLTLTYGLRVDLPMYFDTRQKIEENIARNQATYLPNIQYFNAEGEPVTLDSRTLPSQAPLISPRVGVNYDLTGNGTRKLRGGTGVFTGRLPFVWIGNQVANPNFFFYCVTDPSFRWPQVWKSSLGYDHKFASGWITSVDLLFNRDINAMMVRNYGLRLPTGRLAGVDGRPVYTAADRATVFGGPTNAYVFTNVNQGYSLNASVQVQRQFASGFNVNVAYNYLNAKDAASTDSEISSDAFDRQPTVGHANTPVLAPSQWGNRHRFVGSLAKRFVYAGGRLATTVSAVAEYAEGTRFSYTYFGDLNNDGSGLNDLLFIPTDAQIDQMRFAGTDAQQAAQRAGLRTFIAQDAYLSARRGQYAERYGAVSPWFSNWDVRVLQDVSLRNRHVVQFSLDVLNFGNLLSSNWGVREIASYTGLAQPLGVSLVNNTPVYSFDTNVRTTFFNDNQLISRWRMQLGLRYSF